jgi:hypothetical protein
MAARKRSTAGKKKARKKPPRKKTTGKKTARKKAPRKKAAGKKTARKKAQRKKAAGKKTARKKAQRKKAAGKKTARKKAAPKKTARKKAPAKKAAPKKTAQEAPAPRQTPALQPAPAPVSAPEPSVSIAASVPERIGVVSHYYGHAEAGIITIEAGELRVGDTLHFRGHTTDFYQRVERIEVDHQPVESATVGQVVGVEVSQRVREGDEVSRVSR